MSIQTVFAARTGSTRLKTCEKSIRTQNSITDSNGRSAATCVTTSGRQKAGSVTSRLAAKERHTSTVTAKSNAVTDTIIPRKN